MRYAQFVSEAIWRRIGAGDAWLWLDRPGGTAHADCCMLARQGDWIRFAELLIKDGNYRGEEVIRPGWVARMLVPAEDNVFVVEGSGGNRLWLVPSMQMAILRMGPLARSRADWDDSRIPNLIMRGARDYKPPQARPGYDISKIVPGH